MSREPALRTSRRPLISAGTMLGIGLGGFVDGILLHQILQVHNMLSARRPKNSIINMEINMFWDGLFHGFTWIMTAIGVWMLWNAPTRHDVPRSGRTLVGATVFGWGLFNFIEGLIDHHLLHLHHVIERLGVSVWDWLFLGVGGIGFMLIGGWVIHAADRSTVGRAQ